MPVTDLMKVRIKYLKGKFDSLKSGKESLLERLDEVEIPENIYNSSPWKIQL